MCESRATSSGGENCREQRAKGAAGDLGRLSRRLTQGRPLDRNSEHGREMTQSLVILAVLYTILYYKYELY